MASIFSISSGQQDELQGLSEAFEQKTKWASWSAAAASFLLIGALVVITCGCLCLMLQGVNVINHVILPAVVPGIFGILASLPFILLTIKHNMDKNLYRDQMIDTMIVHLESYQVPEKPRKERIKFILHNFLRWKNDPEAPHKLLKNKSWTKEYQGKILSDLKERIGKDKKQQNPRQRKIADALDKARVKVNAK